MTEFVQKMRLKDQWEKQSDSNIRTRCKEIMDIHDSLFCNDFIGGSIACKIMGINDPIFKHEVLDGFASAWYQLGMGNLTHLNHMKHHHSMVPNIWISSVSQGWLILRGRGYNERTYYLRNTEAEAEGSNRLLPFS